jgi:7-carboxy-7-deazaguanine synthase
MEEAIKRECDNLQIVDLFVSLQGEGQRCGIPSLFIRISGCNLRCCFKDSICDTAYSSFHPEKGKYTKEGIKKMLETHPQVTDVVITGGEPMMFAGALSDLLDWLNTNVDDFGDKFITIETNGTFYPLGDCIDLYSISPKLKTSLPEVGKSYLVPGQKGGGKTTLVTFDKEKIEKLDKMRRNIKTTEALIAGPTYGDFQLKFVYSGKESLDDILEFLNDLEKELGWPVPGDHIYLMPEGVTEEQLSKTGREAAQVCIERGWRFTDRLHIRIWGDKRGF